MCCNTGALPPTPRAVSKFDAMYGLSLKRYIPTQDGTDGKIVHFPKLMFLAVNNSAFRLEEKKIVSGEVKEKNAPLRHLKKSYLIFNKPSVHNVMNKTK